MTKSIAEYFKGVNLDQCTPTLAEAYRALLPLYDAFHNQEQQFMEYARISQDRMRVYKGLQASITKRQRAYTKTPIARRQDFHGLEAFLDSHQTILQGAEAVVE